MSRPSDLLTAAIAVRPPTPPGGPVRSRSRGPGSLRTGGLGKWLVAGLIFLVSSAIALSLATHAIPIPRKHALVIAPRVLRVVGAAVLLFAVCGWGVVRLWLPAALRARELLWVLPVGACTSGLALTVLGFVAVPFRVSLGVVLVAGLALAVAAARRRGLGGRPPMELLAPGYVAALVVAVAIIPMASLGYVTVTGTGSDAHMAAGTAQFLQHSYPTSVDVSQPVNRMPLTWRSKFPIYYAYGAVAELAGLPTWQVLTTLEGVMLALAALGTFLLARETLGAGLGIAVLAMGVVALDRAVLLTGLNPYFNQTWGYFTMPFALVLGWSALRAGPCSDARRGVGQDPSPGALRRRERRNSGLLSVLFMVVGAFAYPLALPIPGFALAIAWWSERRTRQRRGERVRRLADLYQGSGSLLWMVPLGLIAAVPLYGVFEKLQGALLVLAPGSTLRYWGGDIGRFIPTWYFFSLPSANGAWEILAGMAALALLALRRQPRPLAWGLLGITAIGALAAVYFRHRAYGWYFHFKILAFIAPLVLVLAVVGAAGLRRRWATPILILLVVLASVAGDEEIQSTGRQLGSPTIQLAQWSNSLPRSASIRLDMFAPDQLWAGYFLVGHPLCSGEPLYYSDYPRVSASLRADYVLVHPALAEPHDAVGPPLRLNVGYGLYRLRAGIPAGPEACSQGRVQKIKRIALTG